MKKLIITFTFGLNAITSYCQVNNKFYTSVEDYKANKPMGDYEISQNSWRVIMGSESFEIKENGVSDRKKLSKLPSDLFTYNNSLMRRYDGHCYYVLTSGPVCYYILKNEADVYKGANNQFMIGHIPVFDPKGKDIAGTPSDYYSETIKGEINKLKNKNFEAYLEKYNLLSDFEKDKPKREARDSKDSYSSKEINRIVKYLLLVNEKMK